MPTIVPRWEWRAFAESFGEAERRLRELPPGKLQESDELYLLSPLCDANVKVRDDLMDLKALERVGEDRLEQWRPVLKAGFPLGTADVAKVCDALRVAPVPAREGYSLEQLVAELRHPSRGVRAVSLHKRRQRYTFGGCAAELTNVIAEGHATRTVALESEDPAQVVSALRELGLDHLENVSYPRGLRRLLGWPARPGRAERHAVVDVGTNSVKFHIGEKRPDGTWRTLVDRAEVTQLGEGLGASGGSFTPDALERTASAIAAMADEAERAGAPVVAVGTMGVRTARNRDEFVAAVEERCGVRVEPISGEEEARLAYIAVRSGLGLGTGSLVIFDTGGGSSQFTIGRGAGVTERFSVNVGAVRFTETYGLAGRVQPPDLRRAIDAIAADLARLADAASPDALVGMGGAVTNLTAVSLGLREYDPDAVQGALLGLGEVERQIELYRSRSAEERRRIVGLQPERAEVILAGACIVRAILLLLRRDALTVSDRGLRHGLLVDRFGGVSHAGSALQRAVR
jgi:exopolyphosphatase/guanosine-5'-triphosphate,3'-diphosphate pyrophosphatase